MDPRQMKDPAAGVPSQLLPHFHLISKHRYPVLNNPSLETIVGYLLEAPRIMRESAAVQWQFLDAPPDGSLFLTWQPLEYLNTNFASDGYVWGDPEATFNSEVRGYTLQMFLHRAGYKPQAEAVATHSRRRYRLIPNNQQGGLPQPDPALFLVHYLKALPRDQHPAASLQMVPMIQQQLQQRRMIQAGGQLPRKEFMLHDRSSWPVINAPGARHGSAGQLAGAHRRGQSLAHEVTLEEEEDVSRGDALDFMTPRDISRMRYEQHHEWMEEVLESPYATKQIIPPELGLGRKGALDSLTNGFFTAPMTQEPGAVTASTIGKLDPGKAEEFTKLANQRLADMQAELEKMKQRHIKRMEKLRKTTELSAAERKLRTSSSYGTKGEDGVDIITQGVEELVGKKIDKVSNVNTVSKGGLQHIQPIISPPQPNVAGSVASNLQQTSPSDQQAIPDALTNVQQGSGADDQSQQMQSADRSTSAANEADASKPESVVDNNQTPGSQNSLSIPDNGLPGLDDDELGDIGDIEMDGLGEESAPTGEEGADTGDWDMIGDAQVDGEDNPKQDDMDNDEVAEDTGAQASTEIERVTAQQQLPAEDTPGDVGDFDMVNDFDTNMDTAGDALADYGADDDIGLDDSAFGDAFHHHEEEDLS